MGGGGGWSFSADDLSKLKEKVDEQIRSERDGIRRNVFISFVNEDLDRVNLLRGQAINENSGLEFNDWSLREPYDSQNADYIRRGIRERIRQASVTLVYLSESTASSRWVDWEIRESIALGKRVVAMHSGESPPTQLPAAIKEHKIKILRWSHDSIQAAIAG